MTWLLLLESAKGVAHYLPADIGNSSQKLALAKKILL
jgi:hypothetical protein